METPLLNSRLLRAEMIKHGDTNISLSEYLGINRDTFSMKLHERSGRCFDRIEMDKIRNRYQMADAQFVQIFFGDLVSKKSDCKNSASDLETVEDN